MLRSRGSVIRIPLENQTFFLVSDVTLKGKKKPLGPAAAAAAAGPRVPEHDFAFKRRSGKRRKRKENSLGKRRALGFLGLAQDLHCRETRREKEERNAAESKRRKLGNIE